MALQNLQGALPICWCICSCTQITHSRQAIDIRLLPSIVPEDMRNKTALLIEPELIARIKKLQDLIDGGVITDALEGMNLLIVYLFISLTFSIQDEPPKTTCPFKLFAQINSVDVSEYTMQEYEEEIQQPTGLSTKLPSRIAMKSVLISKECGILYEVSNMEGLRSRTFFRKVTTCESFSVQLLDASFKKQNHRCRYGRVGLFDPFDPFLASEGAKLYALRNLSSVSIYLPCSIHRRLSVVCGACNLCSAC